MADQTVEQLWALFFKKSAEYLATPPGEEKKRLQEVCDLLIARIKLKLYK
jgi:hypothetical protein